MSVRLVGWALREAPAEHPELSMGARLLLVYLADHLNEHEGAAYPSQARLARLMGCSDRSIRTYLEELVKAGIVSKTFRKGTSSLYRFDEVRQNLPTYPKRVRKGIPVGAEKYSGKSGNTFRLTNNEPINNTEEEPAADPDKVKVMLDDLRKALSIKRD